MAVQQGDLLGSKIQLRSSFMDPFVDAPDLYDLEEFHLDKKQKARRFTTPMSKDKIDAIPANTKRMTSWCIGSWNVWCDAQGLPSNLLETASAAELNQHLQRLILEANRQDGCPYPLDSLYQLVSGIQRHLRENSRPDLSILDPKNLDFFQSRQVLDARMKELTSKGLGTVKKQAQPLTPEQGIFGTGNADSLINTVFWYNCKCFGLRGGDEHRNLEVEQFSIDRDEQGRYLRFVGRLSKNYQGSLQHRRIQNKDLRIYSTPERSDRCIVDVFSEYLSLVLKSGPFYRRPIKNTSPPKFSQQYLGRNTLSTIVKRFCEKAGFTGNYTNHSGKVTCATTLFRSAVDEQLIKKQIGHRSDSVRAYES